MAWKCPNCRRHVEKSGKCPYCAADYCEVCQSIRPPRQINRHHVSYEPEITIKACDDCHEKIHYPAQREPGDNAELLDRLNPIPPKEAA